MKRSAFTRLDCWRLAVLCRVAACSIRHRPRVAAGLYEMRIYTDADTQREAIAMVVRARHGRVRGRELASNAPHSAVLLRVQDQCVTSEVFGSVKCDCKQQLDHSMLRIQAAARDLWMTGPHSNSPMDRCLGALSSRSTASMPIVGGGSDNGSEELCVPQRRSVTGDDARCDEPCQSPSSFGGVSCSLAETVHVDDASASESAVHAVGHHHVACSEDGDADMIVGAVIYLMQEGRGVGLAGKVAAYRLQEDEEVDWSDGSDAAGAGNGGPGSGGTVKLDVAQDGTTVPSVNVPQATREATTKAAAAGSNPKLRRGLDTVDANRALGLPDDIREYSAVRDILFDLGLVGGRINNDATTVTTAAAPPTQRPLHLLTNNPRKLELLGQLGVVIAAREACVVRASGPLAARYLRSKAERMGHDIPAHAYSLDL